MSTPTRSYEKVFYDLRPAKQVERRMLLDAFGRMMNGGIPIRSYQYTGMGSIYFFDFVLFYKLLGMRQLLSVEYDVSITKRVAFNRPFRTVRVEMAPIGEVIPHLPGDRRHLLWLDYDSRIDGTCLRDSAAAAYHLSPGSILLVTVDAEPPSGSGPTEWYEYYREQAGDYLPMDLDESAFGLSRLPSINARTLCSAIESGVAIREEVRYLPLFAFSYADGHEMVTVGGMIGGEAEEAELAACDWTDASYIRVESNAELCRIRVPRLTRRERLYLDQYMPCDQGWHPRDFELSEEELEAYRDIHQFYPLYGELLA